MGLGVVVVVDVVVVIVSGQQTPIYLMSKNCGLKTIVMLTNLPSMIHM